MTKTPSFQSTWSPFQYSIFRMLWITSLISNIGSWMHEVSAAWLMTTLTHQPILVALVQATTSLSVCLFAIPAGALADIVDKRRLLIFLQTWMMLIAGCLALICFYGKITPFILLLLTFLLGIGTSFNAPAWQSVIPELVPKKELVQAITLNSLGVNFSRMIGPALAGFIIASLGSAYVFALNAISFLGIIFVLYQWKKEATISNLPGERFIGAMKAGIRYVRSSPGIKIVLLKSFSLFFFVSCIWALLPLVTKTLLHKGAIEYGILLAALGMGAVIGALFLYRIRALVTVDKLILICSVAFSIAMFNLIIYPHLFLACLSSFITGVSWISIMSTLNAAVQQSVPSWVRARAISVYLMTFFGSMALGGIFWGALATHFGLSASIFTAGCGIIVANALVYRFSIAQKMIYDHTPSMDLPAPAVERLLDHEEGPVMITVEYSVGSDNIQSFTKAIQDLRLTRLREGAFSWSLYYDIEKPDRFVECFIVESWLEHLRFHERVSVSDRKIQAHVNSFCQTAKPKTTHLVSYDFEKIKKHWKH